MNSSDIEIVRKYGADTAEAMALLMQGDFPSGIQMLKDLVSLLESALSSGMQENPGQGQMNEDGSYITIQQWFLDLGWPAPPSPDESPIPASYIWAPASLGQVVEHSHSDEWVWRPSVD